MSYTCEHCKKELSTKKGLSSHITQMHPEVRKREKQERIEELRLKKYLCPYCDEFGADNLDSLRIHVQKTHDLKSPSKQLHIDLFEEGEHPTCECGCGEKTNFKSLQKGFCDFIQGHWAKKQEDGFYTEEGLKKAAETRRKQFESGEREPWNKGLSLEENPENEGLQKLRRKNLKENCPERVKKISESLTGRELSEAEKDWNEKLQKINKEYWSKEENRQKQRERRAEYWRKRNFNEPSELEREFEGILKTIGLEYKEDYYKQVRKWGFIWDFKIDNTLIEVHGDFYHCHPDKWKSPIYEVQKDVTQNDKKKKKKVDESDLNFIIFWEHDINNNRKEVVKKLIEISE